MIGQKLLHYEILEPLGEGGMGVVYKARDTHLDRWVAVKVLPPEKVADPTRKARFIQEAKAASALNHANIVHIYDIAAEGGVDFIAMEYVAGKTLDQLIPRKGLRLGEALKIAIQIASALAGAHAAGIIHRDLKPSNVMVDEHGGVKLLDFGLAKLVEQSTSDDAATATMAAKTEEGTVVGTAAYMSPEQAEGKPLDARSDIFSFGSVLYEMLTGQRVFQGLSSPATLAAVIQQEPAPLPPEVPHDLAKVVLRSLRKDPAKRFQHMDDLKVALEELKEESDSGLLGVVSESPVRRTSVWPLSAVAAVLLIVVSWYGWQRLHPPAPAPRVQALTSYPGQERYPALSPDGRHVAFSWNGEKQDNLDLYVQLVGSSAPPLRLTSDRADDRSPVWSPDGTHLAFVRGLDDTAAVYLTPALAAHERKVAGFRGLPMVFDWMAPGVSWSPDGKWLAVPQYIGDHATGISLVPIERGEPRILISDPTASRGFYWPAFSHDGTLLAYSVSDLARNNRDCDVHVMELGTGYVPKGSPRRLTHGGATIEKISWAPDGQSLVYAGSSDLLSYSSLWRVALRRNAVPERLEVAGERSWCPSLSVTNNRLAFSRSDWDGDIWKFEGDAAPQRFLSSTRNELEPQFSPDGARIAFASDRSGTGSELWVANRDGTNLICLTRGWDGILSYPAWSPSGRWITFHVHKPYFGWDVYVIDSAGGPPRRLTPEGSDEQRASWSQDEKWIYFGSNRDRGGRPEVYRVPAEGGEMIRITDNGGSTPIESTDRSKLYFQRGQVLMERVLASGEEREILNRVFISAWAVFHDGVYYADRRADRLPGFEIKFHSFTRQTDETLYRTDLRGGLGLTVSPDRRTILVVASATIGADLMLVENFR